MSELLTPQSLHVLHRKNIILLAYINTDKFYVINLMNTVLVCGLKLKDGDSVQKCTLQNSCFSSLDFELLKATFQPTVTTDNRIR